MNAVKRYNDYFHIRGRRMLLYSSKSTPINKTEPLDGCCLQEFTMKNKNSSLGTYIYQFKQGIYHGILVRFYID